MSETVYGIVSDTHENPRVIPLAIVALREMGAQKFILNGDVGTGQEYMAFVLDCFGKSGLETYVQPGSHEKLREFHPVMSHFGKKYGNLISAFDNRKIEFLDHHLVFMPGSDFSCGGEYTIALNDVRSGLYQTRAGPIALTNIMDLASLVTHPDKTIVVCHVPRRFDNLETGVDVAHFGEAILDFILDGQSIDQGSVFPMPLARKITDAGHPVLIKRENRGNVNLKEFYQKLGIKKSITGHFHESVHKATDSEGKQVEEGVLGDELFWNASYLDRAKAGLLTVRDGKVEYRNVRLFDKVKIEIYRRLEVNKLISVN